MITKIEATSLRKGDKVISPLHKGKIFVVCSKIKTKESYKKTHKTYNLLSQKDYIFRVVNKDNKNEFLFVFSGAKEYWSIHKQYKPKPLGQILLGRLNLSPS